MSLRRRLMMYLLISAPVVWLVAVAVSSYQARAEVNELFDSEMIRLARQIQLTLVGVGPQAFVSDSPLAGPGGAADLDDFAVAVWDREGKPVLLDREGAQLPRSTDRVGFVDLQINNKPWRAYYLQAADGAWVVAAGQSLHERDELVYDLIASQLIPWLLMLPVLIVAMSWAVRQALTPMQDLTRDLQHRHAHDLEPMSVAAAPVELQPMLRAINGLFGRISGTLERERRFTADAAHELRTPLAVLGAQWERLDRSADPAERARAAQALGAGIDRMNRLVDQLLRLSRLDAAQGLGQQDALQWPELAREAIAAVLPVVERRKIQLECLWPTAPERPPAWRGDPQLMLVLLRNLLDNACRCCPIGSTVTLRFTGDGVAVENEGEGVQPDQQARLGQRFYRPEGQPEVGSGLGVSIARRVAELHGLTLQYRSLKQGSGWVAQLSTA
ncbi:MAG: two-component sensor histidine kinase [Betaproteobacteria bacterium]|nr:two-component sensor histidine kinase [Betaproteobacteria bacterium]